MRKALLLAIGCLLCFLSQPASATGYYITLTMSRPNTPWLVFFDDRNQCLDKASHTRWFTVGGWGGSSGSVAAPVYNVGEFGDCMVSRGYKLDPNGYRTAWIHLRSDGRYWMGGF